MAMSPVELKDEHYNTNISFSYIDDDPSYIETQPYKKLYGIELKTGLINLYNKLSGYRKELLYCK